MFTETGLPKVSN